MISAFTLNQINVMISVPAGYDERRSYPAVFLNDGDIDKLTALSETMILVGLNVQNRLDDYTPWKAKALQPNIPDFGGKADFYHQTLFCDIIAEVRNRYLIDETKIAYGGYSLGGLAAVYSLYSHFKVSCIFSICGSFWYPDFIDYCRKHKVKNTGAALYLLNGQTEGINHSNRLAYASVYAKEVHRLLEDAVPHTKSIFDSYGHHEALDSRYAAFASWLLKQWQ